jgi:hypothetical protein
VGNSFGGIVISDAYFAAIVIEFNNDFPNVASVTKDSWEVRDSASKGRKFEVFTFSAPKRASGTDGPWLAVLRVFGPESVGDFRDLSIRLKGGDKWVTLADVPLR